MVKIENGFSSAIRLFPKDKNRREVKFDCWTNSNDCFHLTIKARDINELQEKIQFYVDDIKFFLEEYENINNISWDEYIIDIDKRFDNRNKEIEVEE